MAVPARRAFDLPRTSRPALRVVRGRARARRVPFLLFASVLVATLVLLLTSAQALLGQGAFRMSELQERIERLDTEQDLLRVRAARVTSPERIADAARRAGLVVPGQVEVLDG
jgi:cell division protein FtsL